MPHWLVLTDVALHDREPLFYRWPVQHPICGDADVEIQRHEPAALIRLRKL